VAGSVLSILSDDRGFADGISHSIRHESPYKVIAPEERGGADILLVDSRVDNPLKYCADDDEGGDAPFVIFIAAPDDDAWMLQAVVAGARGVVTKNALDSEIIRAVTAVRENQVWAPRRILGAALLAHLKAARPRHVETYLEQALSLREREVLRNISAGLSNKEVAERLGIRPATVKVHLMKIFQKLGVRSRGELAAAYYGALLPSRERASRRRQSA
jgi:DNA-binding NarL/FixJ family response regulator